MALRRQVGIIYGSASSPALECAVSDGHCKRLDSVEAEQDGVRVLCQVEAVERKSRLSLEQAMQIPSGLMAENDDKPTGPGARPPLPSTAPERSRPVSCRRGTPRPPALRTTTPDRRRAGVRFTASQAPDVGRQRVVGL